MKVKFIRGKFKGEIAELTPFEIQDYSLMFYFKFDDFTKNYMEKFNLETFLCDQKGDYELWEN